MGAKGSRQDGEKNSDGVRKINLLQPPEGLPVSVDVLRRSAQAVCSLDNKDGLLNGKGILVSLTTTSGQAADGLITHSVSKAMSSCYLEVKLRPVRNPDTMTLKLDTSKLFTLYCPLAEIMFVRLEDQMSQQIREYGCEFLNVPQAMEKLDEDSQLFLCDLPIKMTIKISCGTFTEYYGLDIRHNALCDEDSAGLPIFSEKGQLVGVQKAVATPNCTNSLAVSFSSLMASHFNNIFSSPVSIESVITNPVDTSHYQTQLKEIGLEECTIPKPKYAQCNLYISPESPYVTPIWYMPTCLGWYWTPTDPNSDKEDTNWMPVTVLAVVGGSWNGQIPAKKNVKIIRWLSLNNIQWKHSEM